MSEQRDLEIIRASLFFDGDWYRQRYSDVERSDADPAQHFLQYGAAEGRDPGPCFDTLGYLKKWPEVERLGINPLVHFARASDFAAHDVETIRNSSMFDADWYLNGNPDVVREGMDPVVHYVEFGDKERRDPSASFSTQKYREAHPELNDRSINALAHFIRHGLQEGGAEAALFGGGVQGPSLNRTSTRNKLGRKVVFVTHDLNIGGAPKLVLSIARWFQRATDYDVHIVAMGPGGLHGEAAAIAPTHVVGQTFVADHEAPQLTKALREFLGEEPAFTFINSAASGHYCKIDPFKAKTFSYIHELQAVIDHYQDQFATLIERSDHVFCGGPQVFDLISETYPDEVGKLTTRPSFIEAPAYSHTLSAAEKAALRKGMGLNPNRKLVTACGVAHWRKQPFVFMRVAKALIRDRKRNVDFLWIGDGEDLAKMREMAAETGIADRVHLVGHQEDVRPYLAASDIFALTSSEDPFPLVCLEAGALSTPSVVFREATGFSQVIEPKGDIVAGAAVRLGDEDAFADAVDHLLTTDKAWTKAAALIRQRVNAGYTTATACTELLVKIQSVALIPPRVSIIVPTYNSAAYLQPRLDSLADQTFRDFEILLFDDASKDNSAEMLDLFAKQNLQARVVVSATNSGSVFKAWERGILAAKGDFVWICEADDWCEPDFLERALQAFEPSGVRLVHGRSIPVNSEGEIAGDWNDLYLDHVVPGLWHASFTSPSAREIDRSLGRANTIVNASGVVVRRSAAVGAIDVARDFKLAGDWAFYVCAIHGGRVAYCHEAVNYHRRHTSSVTASVEGTSNYFQELMNVGAVVRALYGDHEARDAQFRRHIEGEARRFSYPHPLPDGVVPTKLKVRGPAVLYGVGDLSGGGAQMFAVRFVNRWQATNGPAVLFVAGYDAEHHATRSKIDPLVPVVGPGDIEAEGGLNGFLAAYGLDVVLTGHWWADLAMGHLQAREETPAPWAIVMHGCYESVLDSADSFPGYEEHLARAEQFSAHWVWTAPKNRQLFEQGRVRPRLESQIVNGFEPVAPGDMKREDMGLPDDAIVFTIASRALESKGWLVALEAFMTIRERLRGLRDVRLLLIGDGPAAEEIRGVGSIEGVTMVAHTDRLADYIAATDVFLLPSWFVGESLPLTLLEFLAQGKPAVVSDIGMCGWAIGEGSPAGPAGIVVARQGDGTVRASDLASAMMRLAEDAELRKILASRTDAAFLKFNMDDMIDSYDQVLRGAIASTSSRRLAA
ncbi:glycosyltransferase [Brevundimonas sp.]